jgi:hypothetical protein
MQRSGFPERQSHPQDRVNGRGAMPHATMKLRFMGETTLRGDFEQVAKPYRAPSSAEIQ